MSRIRDFARGQDCTLRFRPGCDPQTVVHAHLPWKGQKAMGGKVPDWWGVHACHRCHDVLDRRDMAGRREVGELVVWQRIAMATAETMARLMAAGLVKVGGR